ncbi:chemoreceptor glutamine deamidase CheD [Aquimonas voraii]|uniref:Probable chemoreceptor glutamine deamidase CheD n=1 Tax=Aquimonas voraii TaxID=265719 RepID=A0A1G6W5U1_9GAMM|nr:chemoreceptor glutamine deamidase CheD [Aquimonas voraii]SDD61158.1 chemotaxis protein CheD [Aquimonas voraii]
MSTPSRHLKGPMPYFDVQLQMDALKLMPADYVVTSKDIALSTVLGSCVAACMRDPVLRIGGMNHFMLPDGGDADDTSARYGSYAMELLINELLKAGARRERLEAKVFGGGNVLKSFTTNPVGTRNAEFVIAYLKAERIPVVAQDLGSIHPRKVWYIPATGKVLVRRLPHAHDTAIASEEIAYRNQLKQQPSAGGVELFD